MKPKASKSKQPAKHEEEEEEQQEEEAAEGAFKDEDLVCADCSGDFVFTAGEQEFYLSKGFDNKPVRCKACKDAKKSRMNGGDSRSGGGRGGGGYGNDRGSGGGGGGGVCYANQKGECTRGR